VLLGDVMLAFGGDPLSRVDDLEGLLGGDSVGVERELSLLRAGTELQLSVKPDEKG
jgi:S1-C subfamily serine protease